MNQNSLNTETLPTCMYRPEHEHDSCGVGFVAQVSGRRSNRILRMGLRSICNLMHRGALDADAKTGDGAGILTQIPYKLFVPEVTRLGHTLYKESDLAVGVLFLPHDNAYAQARAKAITEEVLEKRGLFLFGWREVPINLRVLGEKAQTTLPRIEHVLIGKPWGMADDDYERRLFLARNEIEDMAAAAKINNFYIPSFSHRVIVYKGLLVSASVEKFYPDLSNPDYETSICVYHQRYSTNTFPKWPLAQPFRMLAHNGEINTVRGNRIWMSAREAELQADFWGKDIDLLKPIIQPGGSDSASLDNALEVLTMSGRSLLHAVTMLVPPAWSSDKSLPKVVKEFYEYHRCICEPWDGPAALCFSDGITVGASLDRNGLRPARYKLTDDGIFVLGSEVGIDGLDLRNVVEMGRLAPGEMIAIDTAEGTLLRDADIKLGLASRKPYGEWLANNLVRFEHTKEEELKPSESELDIMSLTQQQIAFGYSSEELDMILKPMYKDGAEAVGSMGDDTPLAVLSLRPRLLYTYFKQLFAQVTNPPIDPIREKLVMSLATIMGWRRNLLSESPEHCHQVVMESPIIFDAELNKLRAIGGDFESHTIPCTWPVSEGAAGLENAVRRICLEAESAVDNGGRLIILSDRGVDHQNVAVPMLVAVGAVHHHLSRVGKRMRASIIVETAEARDVHQIACLIGYGASAINPYLAFETAREMIEKGQVEGGFATAAINYKKALENGILKIMSKMGISLVSSYRGAQVFEAIGVSTKVIDECFAGTTTQIQGVGFNEIAAESLTRHHMAFGEAVPVEEGKLEDPGYYRVRRGGELHAVTPPVLQSFHTFVGIKGEDKAGKWEDYQKYVDAVLTNRPHSLRNLLDMIPAPTGPVPIDEVEPIEEIRRRFTSAGMSLGALSPEAHEALAIAMNRIGGKSNSGEGGEDPVRFKRREDGDWANSAIKQIASGRFGVTAAYLASAKEIEIKMAQGAKPGEGGQLPGHKVNAYIAKLRHSVPGVTLISPPPHHDIYSIEDLAQLIYDLKQVNPRARVCVKLVAEAGVGTIAAGVAKAHADIILVSGHDGGTGASPLSSVKNAGGAWEMGVAETHQVLLLNGLRNRVTLRTDGGMRTGEDIVYATLLGAEEYNFGTAALIALGCVYVRQCHLNTCPVGVATSQEKLRAKFKGTPDNLVRFFNAVAQEVREIMAKLGYRTINEMIGRTESLRQRVVPDHPKANTLDLSPLLVDVAKGDTTMVRHATRSRNDGPEDRTLDDIIMQDAKEAINDAQPITLSYKITNVNRSAGTMVSGEIGYQWGEEGLPPGTINLLLHGSSGQSFGAFLAPGVRLVLTGEANDYVGKGMSGGEIVIKPVTPRKYTPSECIVLGNTVMYGATGGALYANGRGGERLCVRNSGGTAVVEGVGDHCCEYMTNGTVVVLGPTGKNFGAGMTGGVAYVLDEGNTFLDRYNPQLITPARLENADDITTLKEFIYKHLELTESAKAQAILADWQAYEGKFWKVSPTVPAAAPAPAEEKPKDEQVINENVTASR
ncbi:MAG: glutamate synthase subunit alpha [Verrucomicrobia bacterium 61-8]|nr:glutamate synthase large subunit [Verrucomicrobiota bacterium]OJV10080.1 MAG: glutamate synthase subunit alpha [Verrucomicrobia bacterium 61-8]